MLYQLSYAHHRLNTSSLRQFVFGEKARGAAYSGLLTKRKEVPAIRNLRIVISVGSVLPELKTPWRSQARALRRTNAQYDRRHVPMRFTFTHGKAGAQISVSSGRQ